MIISGKYSAMAEILSWEFRDGKFAEAQRYITSYFKYHFPLPHNQSWKEYRIPAKVASCVTSFLCGEKSMMESLRKLTGIGRSIGITGTFTAINVEQSNTFTQSRPVNNK